MKIIRIHGGLGNQMFQYAFGKSLAKQFPDEDIVFDIDLSNSAKVHNGYELKRVFGLELAKAPQKDIEQIGDFEMNWANRIRRRLSGKRRSFISEGHTDYYNASLLQYCCNCYYYGWWQDSRYFSGIEKDLFSDFTFCPDLDARNESMKRMIQNCNSVALHVRRGDYLKYSSLPLCSEEYYEEATKQIIKRTESPVFLFFLTIRHGAETTCP
jgi:hypothetical protein